MVETYAMTATPTTGTSTLLDRLLTCGWEFEFFQAVWLLERYTDVRVPVGDRGPVEEESFRFRPDVSLGFPSTDVRRITRCSDEAGATLHYRVETTFMGLYGVSTPLPLHYAIDILRSTEQSEAPPRESAVSTSPDSPRVGETDTGSTPARDFLDVLHHRLLSLFYRSWVKYRYDRAFGMPNRDKISDYLFWLIGHSPGCDAATLGVAPTRLLRYAGILTQRPRSAAMLEGLLLDYWKDLPVDVQQCVGRWVAVPAADRNCLGMTNSSPGDDLTVGEQVYDLSSSFNITMGPTDWRTYLCFLPGGPHHAETCALVAHTCADPLPCTIEIRLRAGEVPEMQLVAQGEGPRLGFTSWVRTAEMPETSVTFPASSVACSRSPAEPPGGPAQAGVSSSVVGA